MLQFLRFRQPGLHYELLWSLRDVGPERGGHQETVGRPRRMKVKEPSCMARVFHVSPFLAPGGKHESTFINHSGRTSPGVSHVVAEGL